MGMNEDDRIRAKNAVHDAAYESFTTLRTLGWDQHRIIDRMFELMKSDPDSTRDEIRLAVIRIARSRNDST